MCIFFIFFFNDTATTEIYTLSLHDALPILVGLPAAEDLVAAGPVLGGEVVEDARAVAVALEVILLLDEPDLLGPVVGQRDRKSTRLNSSHANISYAVFCLKKKKNNKHILIY